MLDVAITALKHTRVQLVAEFNVSRIRYFEVNFPGGMALKTLLYLKRVFTVMASAAGFSLLHLSHCNGFFCGQIVNFGMAGGAFISAEMLLMTESHQSRFFDRHGYIRNFVTLDAIVETECSFAIMAGATGLAFFHLRHVVSSLVSEIENGIMTGLAVIFDALLFEMLAVVEYYLTEIGNLKGDILDVYRIRERAG